MSAVFNKHVDDVGLRTDQERNLFINGPKQEQNHSRSSELDLEEIENVDNESTEGVRNNISHLYIWVLYLKYNFKKYSNDHSELVTTRTIDPSKFFSAPWTSSY